MADWQESFELKTPEDVIRFGRELAGKLAPGDTVLLRGGLGVGKTTLVRGIIIELTGETEVPSPTYTLVQSYDADGYAVFHCDLYRLEGHREIWELGIEEAFETGLILIEWPERIEDLLTGTELNVWIGYTDESRTVTVSGSAEWGKRLD